MAFAREDVKKGLSLPGLIDIIFLLLIFSLVTLSISHTNVESAHEGEKPVDIDLPETKSRATEEVEDILQTLMFEIDYLEPGNEESSKAVFVLYPSIREKRTTAEAKYRALRDSTFQVFPDNFLELNDVRFERLPACRLIRTSLREYKEIYFTGPSLSNTVEVRAIRDTEFRIFNFIMDACSAYGDTIPRVVTRILTEKR